MSVYVDRLKTAYPKEPRAARLGNKWCHLFADSVEELHRFAGGIGMKREWFQDREGFPHYDLIPTRRAVALARGAKEVTDREMVAIVERKKRDGGRQGMLALWRDGGADL